MEEKKVEIRDKEDVVGPVMGHGEGKVETLDEGHSILGVYWNE